MQLVHEREVYGFTLRHSHENDYAVLVDAAGWPGKDGKRLLLVGDPGS